MARSRAYYDAHVRKAKPTPEEVAAAKEARRLRRIVRRKAWELANRATRLAARKARRERPEAKIKAKAYATVYWQEVYGPRGRTKNRAWYWEHTDELRQKRLADPSPQKLAKANRRARKASSPGRHTAADIRLILKAQKARCAYCRASLKNGWHLDHVMPLALGGTNDRRNLQALCPSCNRSKAAKHPIAFAKEVGLLL
jgi:5-methylcytosine-specific restriction endonuclease McrA